MFDIIIYVVLFFIAIILISGIKINYQWQRAVILRLGKFKRVKEAGLFYMIPFIEKAGRFDTRTHTMDVVPQQIITKDSVTVKVDAVVYYHIKTDEVKKALLNVEDWEEASTALSQTTLRDIIGKHDLDDLLTKKQEIGAEIQKILDRETDAWGIQIETVEIRDVTIPDNMERAMAKEAEAIREQRARITKAEGEMQASNKLKEAGDILLQSKNAITLRQLQTWQEIGAEQNSLIIVVPTDMVSSGNMTGLMALGKEELDKMPKSPSKKGNKNTSRRA